MNDKTKIRILLLSNLVMAVLAIASLMIGASISQPVLQVLEECNEHYQQQFEIHCTNYLPTLYEKSFNYSLNLSLSENK